MENTSVSACQAQAENLIAQGKYQYAEAQLDLALSLWEKKVCDTADWMRAEQTLTEELVAVEIKENKLDEAFHSADRFAFLNRPFAAEIARWDKVNLLSAKVKREIQGEGLEPAELMDGAMKSHRVVAIGETHTYAPNLGRAFLASQMVNLKQAGCTHLAVEAPASYQASFDYFEKNGAFPPGKGLSDLNGTVPVFKSHADCQMILQSARKAGIKVIAVDDPDTLKMDMRQAVYTPERDLYMARSIKSILNEDASAKVVFWGGGAHARLRHEPGEFPGCAEMLESGGFSVFSFMEQPSEPEEVTIGMPLYQATKLVKSPCAFLTNKAKALSKLNSLSKFVPGKLKNWDAEIIFPYLNLNQRLETVRRWYHK